MRATVTMKDAEARGGGRQRREGSDVAHRQELARLTHDHTHACTHTHARTQVGIRIIICIYINMFYNLFKFFTSLPYTL